MAESCDKGVKHLQYIFLGLHIIIGRVVCQNPATLNNDCTVISRIAGHVLLGTAQGVITANGVDECIHSCFNSLNRFGFHCLSGIFYYQTGSHNCILNSGSRRSRPELYQADTQDKMEYFEIECAPHALAKRQATRNRNVLQLQTSDFGNWTMCDRQLMQHVRFKQCRTLNPNKCEKNQNDCDPSKEDEYDKESGSSSGGGIGSGMSTSRFSSIIMDTTTAVTLFATETTASALIDTSGTVSSAILKSKRRRPQNGRGSGHRAHDPSDIEGADRPAKRAPTSRRGHTPTLPASSTTRPPQKAGSHNAVHGGGNTTAAAAAKSQGGDKTVTHWTNAGGKRDDEPVQIFNGSVINSGKAEKSRKTEDLSFSRGRSGFYHLLNETNASVKTRPKTV